jgi:hypothetical protein
MEITVNIATQRGREESLRTTINSLREQCQTIRVWCNGFEPYAWLSDMGVHAVNGEDLGSAAKFKFVQPNEYYCTCDDDIKYPVGYVTRLVTAQQVYGGYVSFHGRKLQGRGLNYYRGHKFYHCVAECQTTSIDVPGTGVGCFNTNDFKPDNIEREEWRNMDDVAMGYLLALANVDVKVIEHKAGWIVGIPNADGIWQREHRNPTRQNALADKIYDIRRELPKVSIIIPYVGDRGYLQMAIDSVYNQNYGAEIELVLSQSNKSATYNFNRGLEKSTGKYVKYLCDDDWLPATSILDSVRAIKGYKALCGGATNVFEDGRRQYAKPQQPTLERMLKHNYIHGGSLMYDRDIFKQFGQLDEALKTGEEYAYNLHLLNCGVQFAVCDKNLYFYRRHSQQKSLGKGANQAQRKKAIDEIRKRYL